MPTARRVVSLISLLTLPAFALALNANGRTFWDPCSALGAVAAASFLGFSGLSKLYALATGRGHLLLSAAGVITWVALAVVSLVSCQSTTNSAPFSFAESFTGFAFLVSWFLADTFNLLTSLPLPEPDTIPPPQA